MQNDTTMGTGGCAVRLGGWVWSRGEDGVWRSAPGDAATARAVGLFRAVSAGPVAEADVWEPVEWASPWQRPEGARPAVAVDRDAMMRAEAPGAGVDMSGGETVREWRARVREARPVGEFVGEDAARGMGLAARREASARVSGGSVGLPAGRVAVPWSPSGSVIRLAELERVAVPRRLRAFPGARRKASVGLSARVRGGWDGFASLGSVAGLWGALSVWSRGEGCLPRERWGAADVAGHRADCAKVWGTSRDAWAADMLGKLAVRWARSVRAPGVSDTSREDAVAAARCAALSWSPCVRVGCPAWGVGARVAGVAAARHSLRGDALGGGRMRDESARLGGGLLLSADQAEGLAMSWLQDATAAEDGGAWVPDWEGGPRSACAAVLRRLLVMSRAAVRAAHPPRRRAVRGTYRRVASVVRGLLVDGLPVAEAVERAGWDWDWTADVREVPGARFSGDVSRGRSRSWERAGLPVLRSLAGLAPTASGREARRGEAWREFLGRALARVAARIPAEAPAVECVTVGNVTVDRAAVLRAVGRA